MHLYYGTLKGFDNVVNLVIKDSHERVFSPTEGVEQVPLGLFIILYYILLCIWIDISL
ncbi:unnamed protein product [Trichobilharzia regenti]|nr:unnamed protein product [Trichobilharzia regenti]